MTRSMLPVRCACVVAQGKWYAATISDVRERKAYVRFDGYAARFDETVAVDSARIQVRCCTSRAWPPCGTRALDPALRAALSLRTQPVGTRVWSSRPFGQASGVWC